MNGKRYILAANFRSGRIEVTAGIHDEQDGLIGALTPIAAEQDGDEE